MLILPLFSPGSSISLISKIIGAAHIDCLVLSVSQYIATEVIREETLISAIILLNKQKDMVFSI